MITFRYLLKPIIQVSLCFLYHLLNVSMSVFYKWPDLYLSLVCYHKHFMKFASMLEHNIWNYLNLCSQTIASHIWLQMNCLLSFQGVCVFVLTILCSPKDSFSGCSVHGVMAVTGNTTIKRYCFMKDGRNYPPTHTHTCETSNIHLMAWARASRSGSSVTNASSCQRASLVLP